MFRTPGQWAATGGECCDWEPVEINSSLFMFIHFVCSGNKSERVVQFWNLDTGTYSAPNEKSKTFEITQILQ